MSQSADAVHFFCRQATPRHATHHHVDRRIIVDVLTTKCLSDDDRDGPIVWPLINVNRMNSSATVDNGISDRRPVFFLQLRKWRASKRYFGRLIVTA